MTGSTHLSHGLWVVLASPFDDDLALDLASLERQLDLASSVAAQGVVALGVFGEADALSRDGATPSSAPSRRRTTDRSSSACPAAPPPWWSSRRGTAPRQPRVRPSR